jgi:hypothetical protein
LQSNSRKKQVLISHMQYRIEVGDGDVFSPSQPKNNKSSGTLYRSCYIQGATLAARHLWPSRQLAGAVGPTIHPCAVFWSVSSGA